MSAYNAGDLGLTPGLGRSPGEGNGNPLQYSCLENPMDGGASWATVHTVAKSRTQLSDFTFTFLFYDVFYLNDKEKVQPQVIETVQCHPVFLCQALISYYSCCIYSTEKRIFHLASNRDHTLVQVTYLYLLSSQDGQLRGLPSPI